MKFTAGMRMSKGANRKRRSSLAVKTLPQTIVEGLERNPGVRLAVALIPGASAIAEPLFAHARNLEERRAKIFFEHLSREGVAITNDDLTDEFVHKFVITSAAALRTHQQKKIEHFATMLANGRAQHTPADEYEECLRIVDDLSVRELIALDTLERFESAAPQTEGENKLQHASKFWKSFLTELEARTGVAPGDAPAFLTGITRTGCYLEITAGFLDYDGGIGHTTYRYKEIRKLCVGGKV